MVYRPINKTLEKLRRLTVATDVTSPALGDCANLQLELLRMSTGTRSSSLINHDDDTPIGVKKIKVDTSAKQTIVRLDEPLETLSPYAEFLTNDRPEPLVFTRVVKIKSPNFSHKASTLHAKPSDPNDDSKVALSLIRS